jgi:phenylalanyl-tRNA synthetase beta chain
VAPPAAFGGAPASDAVAVDIADPDLCPRYGATVIRGVQIGESPAWLKARLTHAGMRPINNVVDVTNYVMLGWGQPLHAFDAGKIRGGRLIARRATAGEKIVTLDGVARTLDDQMLVIADVERALVIAGVFGSQDAEIDEHTTDIVLEAANFAGPSILRTEMHTGIRSEASNRFEKGIDANLVPGGLDFAGRLFAELCGGTVAPGMVDAGGALPAPTGLSYRPARTEALLGYAVPAAEQAGILRRLECEVDEGGDTWSVTPATFRPDLVREVDLVEEVGRIAGYGMAPETLPRHTTAGGLTQPQRVRRAVRRALAGCGLDEAITYTFIAPDALAALGLSADDVRLAPVRISNPMSVEQSVMRTMLLPGLLGAVRDNVDRLNDPPNLFEIGKVYLWDEPVAAPEHAAEPGAVLPHEPEALGIVLSGPLEAENWTGAGRATDFYTLKGAVDAALAAVGLRGEYAPLGDAAARFPYLHPGKAALVSVPGAGGVGALGQVRPDVAAACGVDDLSVYFASLNMDRLAPVALATPAFEDLGTYPPASQDLAVVVSRDVPAAAVVDQARRAGGKLVRSVRVFDVYEGDQVPADKRSLALRVVMRSPERTLNEKDIAGVRAKILKALEREFQATLR